ncbi:hypothetical protein A4A49_62252, partial [Nicotiana attenuata]
LSAVDNPKEIIKLDRFDGSNFTPWKDKMIFLVTAFKIFYVLDLQLPALPDLSLQDPTLEDSEDVKAKRNKREDDELLYRGHILNTLTDRLYDRYQNLTSPREIWMALQTTYENEKRGIDKSLSLQYFEFKMVDTKPIMDQIHELKILV